MSSFLRTRVLPLFIFSVYSLLKFTWRIRIVESESFKAALLEGRPMVFAHWHGHELALIHLLGPYRSCAMASTSKDGELMSRVIRLFGAEVSRGSSTRGGVSALKGIIRLSRDGWRPSVAVDGPKGPIYKVKPGVFEISRVISGEIFPLAAAADRKFVFEKSWNKAFLPLPFARVMIVWGDAISPVSKDIDSRDPHLAERLEQGLANAGQQARNLIATP
jgi:lysophospholipid acyltransferase (LPLAT)-like uncharacterized protein